MRRMVRRWFVALALTLLFGMPGKAQNVRSDLLSRVNGLRRMQGLHTYTLNSALNAAAREHANWMARTGKICHYTGKYCHKEEDDDGPKHRALNAGYQYIRLAENIYMGGSAADAWTWWLNSPIHFAGLISPNYHDIGIGSASNGGRNAYVLVFGSAGAGRAASAAVTQGAPAYVLGLDAVGNIKHEVQPGDTIGGIALLYGYDWEHVPTLQTLNEMEESAYLLEIGSVFLIPPADGTFTPAPASPAPADAAPANTPTAEDSATPKPSPSPSLAATPSPALRIQAMPTRSLEAAPGASESSRLLTPLILAAAIATQVGIIGAALAALMRRGG